MTLLIVHRTDADEVVLELHGWLREPETAEFDKAMAGVPPVVRIDLSQLLGADAAGILALRQARAKGARLRSASPYVELLLREPSGAMGH